MGYIWIPVAVISIVLAGLLLWRMRKKLQQTAVPPFVPQLEADEIATPQEESTQPVETVEEPDDVLSAQLVYENYVEGRFSHLLAIAIQGAIAENSPTVSAIEKALGPRNNYQQSSAYLDHMLNAGVVAEDTYRNRKITITPGQFRCIILPKLMGYPPEWGVSQVVEQLRCDVTIMLADFWSEVDTMNGTEFEEWCKRLLEKLGFERVALTKGSGDQGVDILAVRDEVPYAFQCKCWASDIGNSAVQEVYAGLRFYKCNVGVVITNRYFTQGAKDLADACQILLWDRERLKRMMEQVKTISNRAKFT